MREEEKNLKEESLKDLMIKLFGKPTLVYNDYKKTSLYFAIGLSCDFKCMRDLVADGVDISEYDCHNSHLLKSTPIEYKDEEIYNIVDRNPFVESFVFAGLEPLDNIKNVENLIKLLRNNYDYDIVIYTGYNKDEVENQIMILKEYKNIIVKFGRFDPRIKSHKDEVLGVILSSGNQYAERIS